MQKTERRCEAQLMEGGGPLENEEDSVLADNLGVQTHTLEECKP